MKTLFRTIFLLILLIVLTGHQSNSQDLRDYEIFIKHIVVLQDPVVSTGSFISIDLQASPAISNDVFVLNFTTKNVAMSGLGLQLHYERIEKNNNSWTILHDNPFFSSIKIALGNKKGWDVYAENLVTGKQLFYSFPRESTKLIKQ